MEVKKGFKNTKVGFIPNDWEVEFVKNIAQIKTGSRNTQDRIENGLYPFYVRSQTVERINSYSYDGEAVLTAGDGVGVGKVIHYVNEKFDCHQRVYRISDFKSNINGFYFYLYFSNNFYNRIMQMTAKSSVDSVRMEMIADMQIPLPPTHKEQTAIANALSDTDAWINSLEQLLAKKSQIKQGAMQELLLPKEGWEVKTLGETFDVLADYTANGSFETLKNNVRYYSQTNYSALVRTTDLDKKVFEPERFTDKQGYDFLSKTSLFGGELIIANVGSIGKVFKVPYYNMKMTLAPNTYMIKFNKKTSQEFIYQWMLTEEFRTKLMAKVGSTTLLAINKDNLRDIILNIPKDIKEQTRIATILSDMDEEIAQLETKLAKAKQIKQGMMQELLTGRIRLV